MKGLLAKISGKAAVILATTVVGVGALTVGLVKADVFTSPGKMVEKALVSLTDMDEESAAESVFGFEKLSENMKKQGAEVTADISVSDIPGDLFGLGRLTIPKAGLSFKSCIDSKNEKQDGTLDVKIADTTFASLKYYVDKKEAQVSIPQFFEAVLSLPYGSEDFKEQVKKSYLLELVGLSAEDVDAMFAEEAEQEKEPEDKLEALENQFAEAGKNLLASMQVSKNGTIEIGSVDGKNVKCKSYEAVFPNEAVDAYLDEVYGIYVGAMGQTTLVDEKMQNTEAFFEQVKEELSDITLTLDLKGTRIIRLLVEADGEEGNIFMLQAWLSAQGNCFDNMEVNLFSGAEESLVHLTHKTTNEKDTLASDWEITAEGGKAAASIEYEKVSGDFKLEVSVDGEELLVLTGMVTELEKGQSIAVEMEEIRCMSGGEEYGQNIALVFSCKTGEMATEPLSDSPQNVLTMTEADWNALVEEMSMTLSGMFFGLGGLFQ